MLGDAVHLKAPRTASCEKRSAFEMFKFVGEGGRLIRIEESNRSAKAKGSYVFGMTRSSCKGYRLVDGVFQFICVT